MSSRTKDAIIAAIATVLAAVIGAAGLIIANERRDAQSLRLEIERLEADRTAKQRELANILAQLNRVKQELNVAQQQPQDEETASGELPQRVEVTSNLPVVQTERERDFTFGLQACKRSGSTTACYIKVSNEGAERRFELFANPNRTITTRTFDNGGRQRRAESAVIAGIDGEDPTVDLPSRVTVPAVLRFRDIPADVATFSVLDVVFHASDSYRDYKVTFRDVVVTAADP